MTAELVKLAHALGVPLARLDGLRSVPAEDLRTLRRQVGEALFRADRRHFVRIATLASAVPVSIAAKLARFALPPLLAARTAELLEPRRALELVDRLPDGYLADVAAVLDPARCPRLVASMPPARAAAVTAELARRGEWVVIGGFAAQVSGPALAAAVAGLAGDQVLQVGYVLDDVSRLDELVAALTDRQLAGLLAAAADGRWAELDALVANLADRSRLSAALGALPAEVADAVRPHLR